MPRPDTRKPGIGQTELFEALPTDRPGEVVRGRHARAMDAALDAARQADALTVLDEGLATALRAAATSLDVFEKQNQPYGPTKLLDPLVNALREARLTPDSRAAAADDEVKDLLRELAAPDSAATPSHTA